MQKPTRLKIFLRAVTWTASATLLLAAVLATTRPEEFEALREALAKNLSNVFVFWSVFFLLSLILAIILLLGIYYGVSGNTGRIFSHEGVLLFDREQHIAVSVPTMKAILIDLAKEAREGRANQLIYDSGRVAGKRFGSAFKDIYVGQIEPQGKVKPWNQLNDNEKLDAWESYDSTAGWGSVDAHKFESNSKIHVSFRHPTLYDGPGGELFSWLLAGYSQEVVAALIGHEIRFDVEDAFLRDVGILQLHFRY